MDDLWRHATLSRMTNVMQPYIEAITPQRPIAPR